MTQALNWPDADLAHKQEVLHGGHRPEWVPARADDGGPYLVAGKTCSYCGGLHPADLLAALQAGGCKLHQADWKYGYPHKLYLDLPNLKAGALAKMGSRSMPHEPTEEDRQGCSNWVKDGNIWRGEIIGPAPEMAPAKFYTRHLLGAPTELLEPLAELIERHTGVRFSIREGDLYFVGKNPSPWA